MKFLKDFKSKGKRVLVRIDIDVPLDEKGRITDDLRIRRMLPTINYLLKQRSKIILFGHMGRPKGKIIAKQKTDVVAEHFSKLLNKKVKKLDACIGKNVEQAIANMKNKDIVMLENLRFYKEERANDKYFAKKLASYADTYVNEAFANSHREHASMASVPKHLPSYAGIELEREIKNLALKNIKKPLIVIIGGAKLETKVPVIKNLSKKADKILIGGAVMFTFLEAKGFEIGKSLLEDEWICIARNLAKNKKLILPTDAVIADNINSTPSVVSTARIPVNKQGLDIGPESIKLFEKEIKRARTIIWNGPMGAFEHKNFAKGTEKITRAVSSASARTVVGGGDTLMMLDKLGLSKKINFISSGGGAMLDYLSGKKLPGIKVLN